MKLSDLDPGKGELIYTGGEHGHVFNGGPNPGDKIKFWSINPNGTVSFRWLGGARFSCHESFFAVAPPEPQKPADDAIGEYRGRVEAFLEKMGTWLIEDESNRLDSPPRPAVFCRDPQDRERAGLEAKLNEDLEAIASGGPLGPRQLDGFIKRVINYRLKFGGDNGSV